MPKHDFHFKSFLQTYFFWLLFLIFKLVPSVYLLTPNHIKTKILFEMIKRGTVIFLSVSF